MSAEHHDIGMLLFKQFLHLPQPVGKQIVVGVKKLDILLLCHFYSFVARGAEPAILLPHVAQTATLAVKPLRSLSVGGAVVNHDYLIVASQPGIQDAVNGTVEKLTSEPVIWQYETYTYHRFTNILKNIFSPRASLSRHLIRWRMG